MYYSRVEGIQSGGEVKMAKPGFVFDVYTVPNGNLIIEETEAPLFFPMTRERMGEVSQWLKKQEANTENEMRFLQVVRAGLHTIDYDYEVLTIEPCKLKGSNRYLFLTSEFEEKNVCLGNDQTYFDIENCIQNSFVFGKNLEMGLLSELFIWYAWRIQKGYWNLNVVCNDTGGFGYYGRGLGALITRSNPLVNRSWPAQILTAGFKDNVGNSEILVKVDDNHVTTVGHCCSYFPMNYDGKERPIGVYGDIYTIEMNEAFYQKYPFCKDFYVVKEPVIDGEFPPMATFNYTSPFIVNRLK